MLQREEIRQMGTRPLAQERILAADRRRLVATPMSRHRLQTLSISGAAASQNPAMGRPDRQAGSSAEGSREAAHDHQARRWRHDRPTRYARKLLGRNNRKLPWALCWAESVVRIFWVRPIADWPILQSNPQMQSVAMRHNSEPSATPGWAPITMRSGGTGAVMNRPVHRTAVGRAGSELQAANRGDVDVYDT